MHVGVEDAAWGHILRTVRPKVQEGFFYLAKRTYRLGG